jgi:hypothetical protein
MSQITKEILEQIIPPPPSTLTYAWKLSALLDKPVLSDYWEDSCTPGKIYIGVQIIPADKSETGKEEREEILVKNAEEYTSPIQKMLHVRTDTTPNCLIITENSIYVIRQCEKRKINIKS